MWKGSPLETCILAAPVQLVETKLEVIGGWMLGELFANVLANNFINILDLIFI